MIALEPVTRYLATIIYSLKSKLWSVKWFTLETLPVTEEISSTWQISRNKFEKKDTERSFNLKTKDVSFYTLKWILKSNYEITVIIGTQLQGK